MTAAIATIPVLRFWDGSIPAAGGTVNVYDANTLTPAVTWNDRDQATIHQNANPLTLNTNGEGTFYLESGKFYDFLVKNSLGATIGNPKGISGSSSGVVSLTPWQTTGLIPTFISTRLFSLVGNQTADYHVGRRVRTTNTGGTKYATIISSVFSSVTTIVLGFQNNTDVLDAGLSAVDISIEPYVNPAIMQGDGSIIDLTGYSGADVALGIGQTALYTVTATTSLLLRIATADGQVFRLTILPDLTNGNSGGLTLSPNNTAALNIYYSQGNCSSSAGAWASSFGGPTTLFNLSYGGAALHNLTATIMNRTNYKAVYSDYMSSSLTVNISGFFKNEGWGGTTWSSLGTLNFNQTLSGIVALKREL